MLPSLIRSSGYYAIALGLLGGLLFLHSNHKVSAKTSSPSDSPPRPVLVELFTSEGCSSCPPADALLKRLSETQPVAGAEVIALEEHVDYWNHLGWTDPFSTHAFSQRQDEYANSFGTDSVYTPQMVVDGQFELVGSRGDEARKAIQKAAAEPKLQVTLSVNPKSAPGKPILEIQLSNPNKIIVPNPAELWLAVTEANLQSDVKAGENSGEVLKHAAVVRSLRKVETLRDASSYKSGLDLAIDPKWKAQDLSAVVFIADKNSHKIIGSAITPLRW